MADRFGIQVAPDQLWQAINPWTAYLQGSRIGFVNIDLGQTSHPEVEQAILDEVGSYGRQLGRIGDALEVLVRRLPMDELTPEEKDCIALLKGQLAAVRQVKTRLRD